MEIEPDAVILAAMRERREAPRDPTRTKAVMLVHDKLGEHAGILGDVSRVGMKIRSRFCFPCGSEVTIMPPSNEILILPCARVQIVRQNLKDDCGDQVFDYGLRFVQRNDPARHAWFLALRQPLDTSMGERIVMAE